MSAEPSGRIHLTDAEIETLRPVLAPVVQAVNVLVGAMRLWAAPPPPKVESGMTAREYRAARRRYRRLRESLASMSATGHTARPFTTTGR